MTNGGNGGNVIWEQPGLLAHHLHNTSLTPQNPRTIHPSRYAEAIRALLWYYSFYSTLPICPHFAHRSFWSVSWCVIMRHIVLWLLHTKPSSLLCFPVQPSILLSRTHRSGIIILCYLLVSVTLAFYFALLACISLCFVSVMLYDSISFFSQSWSCNPSTLPYLFLPCVFIPECSVFTLGI